MTSNIISRAACLAELTSNPKSFFNCPDMHGGPGLPEGGAWSRAVRGKGEEHGAESMELATASLSERRTF
jgi:hypothetical protein